MANHKHIISMLALKDSVPIKPEALAERVKSMFPWIAKDVGGPVTQGGELAGFLLPIREAVVTVIPVHVPIPDETTAFAIGMNWFWDDAAAAFKTHRAHIIVSALTASNDPRLMRSNAQLVTVVTAALADMLRGVAGIYWVTANNVLAPDHFITDAKDAGEDKTPYDLWVATHFYPGTKYSETNPELIARSKGLEVFTGREVECGPYMKESSELGPLMRMVGWYALDRRVEFSGGETIGTVEEPLGKIELARTGVGVEVGPVYRLILEQSNG